MSEYATNARRSAEMILRALYLTFGALCIVGAWVQKDKDDNELAHIPFRGNRHLTN